MASTVKTTEATDHQRRDPESHGHSRVAIACQGGGSHTAFSSGVLQELLKYLQDKDLQDDVKDDDVEDDVEIVALSGTSGGAICATLAWDGLVRGDYGHSIKQLKEFWESTAASDPWDAMIDLAMMYGMAMREVIAVPEISPYNLPTWGEEQFRALLDRFFDYELLCELACEPDAPGLQLGAVEVLSGQFEVFTGKELCTECLLASAAIPELYRAVTVPDRGVYWDGLFSQNPPIHDLTDFNINELWVIQINPSACSEVPMQISEIKDRRNALAGNLSMEQELREIEMINRALAKGIVLDPKFHPIFVSRIQMDREFGCRSKMSRSPEFLADLERYGRSKARLFLREREGKLHTLKALGVIS